MPARPPAVIFRPRLSTFTPPTSLRPLTTTPRLFLKEDQSRTPEELERKKQEHLDKQKQGKGHWEEKLGSQSEGNVAADREEVQHPGGTVVVDLSQIVDSTK